MNIIQQPAISGAVLVGTIAGETLYSAPYAVAGEAHVAPELLKSFELVWQALPEVLGQLNAGRFDLMVRQRAEGAPEEVTTYWQSGLSAGALCGLVSRRLRQLRAAVYVPQRPHATGVTVTEVHPKSYDALEWVPQVPVDHAEAIRQQLSDIIWGEYR